MLTVGEVARRTGLTVRALHHWDELGLLTPSVRSRAGYRLYGRQELERLQRIVSLKQVGLSLEEVRACLERPDLPLERVLDLHIERLERRIEEETALLDRLRAVSARLKAAETLSVDDITRTIEATLMFEKHFTPEQLRRIEERGRELGPEAIRAVEEEWPRLIASMRAAMERGEAPESDAVRPLARRWKELVEAFTGGDAGIERGVASVYREEPVAMERTGLDPEVMRFAGRAMAALE